MESSTSLPHLPVVFTLSRFSAADILFSSQRKESRKRGRWSIWGSGTGTGKERPVQQKLLVREADKSGGDARPVSVKALWSVSDA